jgi:F-type H+-transporting ATPase subunit b
VYLLAAAAETAAASDASGLSINFFWVIVAALNFLLFFVLIWTFAFRPISTMLADRQARIEQGLADAEEARHQRDAAQAEREKVISDARSEASSLIASAQKAAQDLRESDIAATRAELDRLRDRAAADIAAERDRAMADLQAHVADLALAAAGRVVAETMTEPRQRRLVEDFIRDQGVGAPGPADQGRSN